MDWPADLVGWPHAAVSRRIDARPHRWHVQEMGAGPPLLLLHGAGGATQSWRTLLPLLAARFRVVAPDLPGQGFTAMGTRQRCGLAPMAEDLWRLVDTLEIDPALIVGHSAGGALALQMALTRPQGAGLRHIVGLNAALGTFDGVAGWLFPALAKLLAMAPGLPARAMRAGATPRRLDAMLAATGSRIGPEGQALYGRLLRDRAHVEGTLAMMAQWRVDGLLARLDRVDLPVTLITGSGDRTVPLRVSAAAAARLPRGRHLPLDGLGHLAHEEDAARVAEAIALALDTTTPPDRGSDGDLAARAAE
ncbi:alpha/beta fold hydrolase [Rhodobacteraceae bacterium CCMM004]|nr:alpha/beta fold hydrolase [Rhodobacteraceae bacterium CCMM004]